MRRLGGAASAPRILRTLLVLGAALAIAQPGPFADEPAKPAKKKPKAPAGQTQSSLPADLQPWFVAHGDRSINQVYLTFDDGPHPKNTPKILAELERNGIQATFFMVGEMADSHSKTAKLVAEKGMAVGNHTMHHKNMAQADGDTRKSEMDRASACIVKATGGNPTCFRPPYGAFNAQVVRMAADRGWPTIYWTVEAQDYRAHMDPAVIADRIVRAAHAGDIILLHDLNNATADAVPSIIEGLKRKGLGFGRLEAAIEFHKQDALRRAQAK